MSDSADLDRAVKAKAVLESQAYQDAYRAVREALISGIEKCPMADVTAAEDFRRCLKLLGSVQANMATAVNSGKLALFKIQQEDTRSKNPFRSIFREKS